MAPDDDFAPEELAMLRDFFRDEAHEALEKITARVLACGKDGPDAETATELMRTTHTLKGSAGTVGLPEVVELSHRLEDHFARLEAGKLPWSATAQEAFVETIDALRGLVDVIGGEASNVELADSRVRDGLAALDRAMLAEPQPKPQPQAAPEPAVEAPTEDAVSDGVVAPFAGSDDSTRSVIAGEMSGSISVAEILRVEPEHVDRLMDGVGELVFDRTRIERRVQQLRTLARELGRTRQRLRDHIAGGDTEALRAIEGELARQVTRLSKASATLLEDADGLRRTAAELQEGLTRVRMQTAGALLERLAPPFRAIARAAGKKVRLETAGREVEFDKALAEQIADPLVQLLRNAIAHGIEPERERVLAGKPAEGTLRIAAHQESGVVVLEVTDDGAGIDPATLRRRFVESGRWSKARADVASDEDVLRSLFDAGMSTRDDADELAGRGVGLDAVRESVARLGGEIRMTSTPGKGTTFTLLLPVSTAVGQAMLFKVAGQVYALPNVHVVDTVLVDPLPDGGYPETIEFDDETLPLVSLHDVLCGALPRGGKILPCVVVDYAGRSYAVTADKVVGPRQIVVKHLGPLLAPLPLYAGATVSGSGKVQLILDPATLMHMAHPDLGDDPVPTVTVGADVAGRALVADDSRAIRETMTRLLARAGYIVDVAEDGEQAWTMLRELDYDVLLTDLEMPRLGGFELVERLRADEHLGGTPVIVISSRGSAANRRRAKELGVVAFVAKPVTRRKLADALGVIAE